MALKGLLTGRTAKKGACNAPPYARCTQIFSSQARATFAAGLRSQEARVGYRKNVGICLVNSAGLVFAARRCDDKSSTWQMPQGGIDRHESASEAALRELQEETGITSACVVGQISQWLTYDFPTRVRNRQTGGRRRYKGQTQKWVLMYFYGREAEIDLDAGDNREFLEYRWVSLSSLPLKVVHFKALVYSAVCAAFLPLINQRLESWRAVYSLPP